MPPPTAAEEGMRIQRQTRSLAKTSYQGTDRNAIERRLRAFYSDSGGVERRTLPNGASRLKDV